MMKSKGFLKAVVLLMVFQAVFTAVIPQQSYFPTDAQKQEIVDKHNYLRRQIQSSNMQHMSWNEELAIKAQELSATCIFAHNLTTWDGCPFGHVGQNLYLGNPSYDGAIQMWYDEITDYDFSSNTCSAVCGHYTQVVWDNSREVGCAMHHCDSALNPRDPNDPESEDIYYKNRYIITCNYGPAGNYPRQPFQLGTPCSSCEDGSGVCNDGLCDADCTTCSCDLQCAHGQLQSDCTCLCDDGYRGATCSDICEDTHAHCGANPGWPKRWCGVQSFVDDSCHAMCGQCVPLISTVYNCANEHEHCNSQTGWQVEDCQGPNNFVQEYCQEMCGLCD